MIELTFLLEFQSELNLAEDFRGAALGAVISERRDQKQLEAAEFELSDDDDELVDENDEIIIQN